MKKRLYLVFISFFMMGSIFASESALIGDWDGTRCSSYDDSTAYGTYNWRFDANTVNTYIQYHTDRTCTHRTFKSIQASGTYQLEKNNSDSSSYTLTVQFTHLGYPLEFNVNKEGNTLVMTNVKGGNSYTLTNSDSK